ncbi:MAG: UDP-N-acetylmuramoyl-tripeptide--D-alanyl-D-alanine ligase [Nitrospira sp.]|jgi:UDP-N-acetylmuramoyl-tripeptide--D-alanyl-D-alanine ligase|nr:UDP-N-acetylmuramoyl-tripeptide--D-alanyl-D-alanine ligase [Nitrospira sp.]
MALFTIEELREVISVKVLAAEGARWAKQRIRRINLDSRTIRAGDLFVAIKGDRFDGHEYVAMALSRGAVGAIVHDAYAVPPAVVKTVGKSSAFVLGVRDPLFAYQQLATHHRCRFEIPLVAVTGSNGKTTTKEMVASVLGQRWRTLKTEGNLNNRIGVPQTLFRLTVRHEAAVIELGVDNVGQTTRLCEIARPTIGIITNIGPDHLEFFGSMEGSAQAKAELLDLLPPDGAAVLNADDPYFDYLAARAQCRVVSFGYSPKADVQAVQEKSDGKDGTIFRLLLPGKVRHTIVRMKVQGSHNVTNALAAAAVGTVLGISGAVIAQGLSRFRPAAMRSQVVMSQGVKIINDCYNANPASMKAAVQLLAQSGAGRKTIAVLGDMLELGPNAGRMHQEVGAFIAQQGITQLVACGALGRGLAEGARRAGMSADAVLEMPDAAAAAAAVTAMVAQGNVVLVKASRGMKMEQVVSALQRMKRAAKKAS